MHLPASGEHRLGWVLLGSHRAMSRRSADPRTPTASRLLPEARHPGEPTPELLDRVATRVHHADARAVVGALSPALDRATAPAARARRAVAEAVRTIRWPHLVVMAMLTPVVYLAYAGVAGPTATGTAWTWLLGLDALVAAAVLATYVPGTTKASSPCAATAGLQVFFALFLLGMGPSVPMRGVFAFAALTFALVQRSVGAGACSVR